ncbi:hypothetical protein SNE40_013422 [Patella caerulea]|uniref:Ig-like domain-containing protein n=1 Tax=Patella caerulea TaxID=87958 RepID=A0AAN8PH50_PATCE
MDLFWFSCLLVWPMSTVRGQTFELKAETPYSVIGASHGFTCKMVNGGFPGAAQGIRFMRNGDTICSVNKRNCNATDVKGGRFTCGCIKGDNSNVYLNISGIETDDEAKWKCGLGLYNLFSDLIDLPLYYGPGSSMTTSPATSNSHTVNEGSSLGPITCTSNCKPPCTITWFKDSKSSAIVSNSPVLYLTDVKTRDKGTYVCQAANLIGSNTTTIKIHIYGLMKSEGQTSLSFGLGVGVGIAICAIVMIIGICIGVICHRRYKLREKGGKAVICQQYLKNRLM